MPLRATLHSQTVVANTPNKNYNKMDTVSADTYGLTF